MSWPRRHRGHVLFLRQFLLANALTTAATAHRNGIDMPLGDFVPPFLLRRRPGLRRTAIAADEGPIDVVVRQQAVGIDVAERVMIGRYRPQRCSTKVEPKNHK